MIRRQFSLHVPLVIIPDFGHRSEIEKYLTQSETYVFWYSDQSLVNLTNRLVQSWTPVFICKDSAEENKKAWLVKEQMLANAEYDREVDLIRGMTDIERKQLIQVIEKSFRPDGISCGSKVFGFAFDPITCESAMTNKDGLHRYAKDMLVNRLEIIEAVRQGKGYPERELSHEIMWRIVFGYLFTKIDGFKFSILNLVKQDSKTEDMLKTSRYLLNEKKYIPISNEGKLIG